MLMFQLRMLLVAALTAFGLIVPPHAVAEPYNCPPACDRIPYSAWIPQWAIPLNARYTWPQLAAVAVTAVSPRFRFEELCGSPPVPQDPRSYAIGERASVVNPAGQWQLQAQILHWRGETWRGGQLAQNVFSAAAAALRSCQTTNAEASPSITVSEPTRFAAVISGPVVVHEYLVANPDNSTVTELAMWSSTPPLTPWPAVSDADLLDELNEPLCTAYLGSCP
jgi:hypothetical protein